jgi:KUP system potassium uptake protein
VYVPAANWTLFFGTALLALGFQSSDALAGAYGIAVSATMVLAGLLVLLTPTILQRVPRWLLYPMLAGICLVDLIFFSSNIFRVFENGWVPIAIAVVIYVVMSTWSEGRRLLNWSIGRQQLALDEFNRALSEQPIERAAGTAVYLANEASSIPLTLVQQLKFHRFLHERVIILTFARAEIPRLANEQRIECRQLEHGIIRVTARYGFMERPDAIGALRAAEYHGIVYEPNTTTYVVGRTTPNVTRAQGLPMWRKRLYALMARNTRIGYEYFGVPTHRLLEIGNQVDL